MGHAVSLYELLVYLRNFFPGLHWQFTGEEITGNRIVIPGLETGDYYLIEGSRRNNGIHVYGDADLRNETYTGIVTEICVPPEVLAVLEEINTWQEKNAEAVQARIKANLSAATRTQRQAVLPALAKARAGKRCFRRAYGYGGRYELA